MPVTQQDIDNLTLAIASGERQVTIGNQSITYRSISELLAARDQLIRDLQKQEQQASGTVKPRVFSIVQQGRGYDE